MDRAYVWTGPMYGQGLCMDRAYVCSGPMYGQVVWMDRAFLLIPNSILFDPYYILVIDGLTNKARQLPCNDKL